MPKAPTSRIKAAQGGVAALPLQGLHTREHVVSTLGSIRNEHGFLSLSLSLSLSLPPYLSVKFHPLGPTVVQLRMLTPPQSREQFPHQTFRGTGRKGLGFRGLEVWSLGSRVEGLGFRV